MRRVLAISLAIVIVMIATRGVMAQDAEQSVSDRLLEILKERQIISTDEYGELKGLATEMEDERAELNTRLGDLDRSITEYLAKDGDALGSDVTYQVGNGFTFATTDGRFSLTIGGMFQFMYEGLNRKRNPFGCDTDCFDSLTGMDAYDAPDTLGRRDTNSFALDNRFHFEGHAFDPNLEFYFEFMASDHLSLFEGWINYNVNDWFNVKAGKQRVPTGRQALIHQSDLSFGNRAFQSIDSWDVNAGWSVRRVGDMAYGTEFEPLGVTQDLGLTIWNLYEEMFGTDMAAEYSVGFFNGGLAEDNNWLAPAFRLAFYPMGYIPYVEGDWTSASSPKFGIGVNYGSDIGTPHNDERTTFYSWDAVMTWVGIYLTAEYHSDTYNASGISKMTQRSWFVEAGYMIMPQELELLGRFSCRGGPKSLKTMDQTQEWSLGAAYYFEGHHLKGIVEFGQQKTELASGVIFKDPSIGFFRLTFQLEW